MNCRLANGMVVITLTATPGPSGFARAVQAFAQQHEQEDLGALPVLIDASRPDLATNSFPEVQERAHAAATLAPPLSRRWALFVSTPLHFGKGRQYAALLARAGIEMGVFMSEEAARAWLEGRHRT